MPNTNIRTSEYAWANLEVKLLGRTIKGLREISYKKTVEKEHLYGAGADPLDIQVGNKKYEGSIKLLGFEVDALNKAAQLAGFDDITEVPHDNIAITAKFKKSVVDPITFVTISGIAFTEDGLDMAQNAKHRETSLPFIAMNIIKTTN